MAYFAFGKGHIIECTTDYDSLVIMQSTGLCDKNGKEIFESDVLLFVGSDHFPRFCAVVKWHEDSFRLVDRRASRSLACWIDAEDPDDSMVVIGNIYEHPELMKETK